MLPSIHPKAVLAQAIAWTHCGGGRDLCPERVQHGMAAWEFQKFQHARLTQIRGGHTLDSALPQCSKDTELTEEVARVETCNNRAIRKCQSSVQGSETQAMYEAPHLALLWLGRCRPKIWWKVLVVVLPCSRYVHGLSSAAFFCDTKIDSSRH